MTFQNEDPHRKCIITILTITSSATLGRIDKNKEGINLKYLVKRKEASYHFVTFLQILTFLHYGSYIQILYY